MLTEENLQALKEGQLGQELVLRLMVKRAAELLAAAIPEESAVSSLHLENEYRK